MMGARSGALAVGVRGLVSIPTTQKPARIPQGLRSAQGAQAEAAAMRQSIPGALVPDQRAARIARMRRSVGFSARMHVADLPGHRADSVVMVTATYRDGADWKAGHVRELLDHIRKWCNRNAIECRYVWVGELQARGAIHYHVALWLPFGSMLPKADAQGWWPHGSTRTELARKAVPYLMKYLSKGTHFDGMPKGARMHGAGGLDHSMRRARRWLGLPGWIKARSDIYDDWRPCKGGGWTDPDGVCIPSEFQRVWLGDAWGLLRVADYGRPFKADGAFSWLHRSPMHKGASHVA
jgi:hypothetical protein